MGVRLGWFEGIWGDYLREVGGFTDIKEREMGFEFFELSWSESALFALEDV